MEKTVVVEDPPTSGPIRIDDPILIHKNPNARVSPYLGEAVIYTSERGIRHGAQINHIYDYGSRVELFLIDGEEPGVGRIGDRVGDFAVNVPRSDVEKPNTWHPYPLDKKE